MDFLIVGRFRAMSTPSNGGAMCKTIAGLDFAHALPGDSLELAELNANTCYESRSAEERAPRDIS